MINNTQFLVRLVAASLMCGPIALAAETSSPPSKEVREKMAQAHDKMAACLRSDRTIAECRTEMMQTCHDMMGDQGCGMGMMGHGMKHAPHDAATKTK